MILRSSRPLILASGGDGSRSEYELASVYYQILNCRAADGAAYITVSSLLPEGSSPGLWNHLIWRLKLQPQSATETMARQLTNQKWR